MILQWVKLHNSAPSKSCTYGLERRHPFGTGAVIIGHKTQWFRPQLWKCIEYDNGIVIEHIVKMDSLDKPIITLTSKIINRNIITYSQCYIAGINNICNSKVLPLSSVLFNKVLTNSLLESEPIILNCMNDWKQYYDNVGHVAPNNSDLLFGLNINDDMWTIVQREMMPVSDIGEYIVTTKEPVDSLYGDPNILVNGIFESLVSIRSDIQKNYCGHSAIFSQLTEVFAPWDNCGQAGILTNKKSFYTSNVSVQKLDTFNSGRAKLDNLVAPRINEIASISSLNITQAPITKEVTALVNAVNLINYTDMQLLFDTNKFSHGDYSAIKITAFNRYYRSDDGEFPDTPTEYQNIDYSFTNWTDSIGSALCDVLLSSVIDENMDLIELTKTYNEELVFYFRTYDGELVSQAYYIDIIGCLLTGSNVCRLV